MVVVLLGVYSYRKLQALAADPAGEKDCGPAVGGGEQAKIDLERVKAIAPLKDVKWSQLGGSGRGTQRRGYREDAFLCA